MTHIVEPRLKVHQVTKLYGDMRALDGANLEVQPGEIMALLGQNGAGKSTLVRILSGLEQPDGGEIQIDGQVVDLGSPTKSRAAGVAVVQQEISAARNMSIAENLVLGDDQFSWVWQKKTLRRHARVLLEQVGLGHLHPMAPMSSLSIGEMQLIEIARVLGRDAKLIIFDEPTAALSDAEIKRILDLVQHLAAHGRSIIYVTHRLKEVFQIADRVTVFRAGQDRESSATRDVTVESVVQSMVGHEVGRLFPPLGELGEVVLSAEGICAPGLEPIDLPVRSGEILGLTGQLGSGHSILLEACAGLVPHTLGTLRLAGTPLDLSSRKAGLDRGVAYCSEDRKRDGMFAEHSVINNLSSPWLRSVRSGRLLSRRTEETRAFGLIDAFGVDPARARSAVGTLSGGNQQKVAIAKWMGAVPKVLLLNEPTRGVDVGARAEIYEKLRALCNAGMAVVIASSDVDEVLGLCDTITTFYRGRVTASLPREQWTESRLLREVMHEEEAAAS